MFFLVRMMPPCTAWHSNRDGKLPLHVAAEHWAKLKVMKCIKDAYPAAVNQTDNHGELPIAFAQKSQDQAILALLEPKDGVTPGKQKWSRHLDAASGSYYYLNNFTKESSWEKPADFEVFSFD